MIEAAGIIFREPGGRVLLLERDGWDDAGLWAYPGGMVEGDETPEAAARREAKEEIGTHPEGPLIHLLRRAEDGVDYTTFLMRVADAFDPDALAEHSSYEWMFPEDALDKLKLHPGAALALKRIDMNEMDVAKAIAKGEFQSPQFFRNMWLFAIRITGTGMSYRGGLKEHVWRDRSFYLNDAFLERCQGLPVIWIHPEKRSTLNSKEFADRVIGTVMHPYIKDDEVWGIARIYDADAAQQMSEMQISTSPGVSWDDPTVNSTVRTKDGKKLLIEGDPSLLDHIAVVEAGVWDKGGPPTGVQNDLLQAIERADSMSEKEVAAANDADAGTKLDKILTHLDSLHSRMDAFEEKDRARDDAARKDAEEKEAKERADAKARRDAEHDEFKKSDPEMCAKDDEDEAREAKELEEAGEPEHVAADKARAARKDRMKARKDAEEAEKKVSEEKAEDERKDAARFDAQAKEIESLKRELRAFTRGTSEVDKAAMTDEQARCDAVYRALGKQAPHPMSGETVAAYRVRLHKGLQEHSKAWSKINLSELPSSAHDNVFGIIRNDAMEYARNPDDLQPGQFREVPKRDGTGRTITEFVGKDTIFHQMSRRGRHVTAINTKFN